MSKARWIACLGVAMTAMGVVAAPANAARGLVVLTNNRIAVFDTLTPTTVATRAITGLGASETVRGADLRVSNGVVYATTAVTGSVANSLLRTYTIDPDTGAATFRGAIAAPLAGAADVATGLDINPRGGDRLRYVNTNDENARLNQDNGALAGNDTDLTPAVTTTLIAAAYDVNLDGTGSTLYVIDRNNSVLGLQGGVAGSTSPNGGVVTDLGPLGFTLDPASDGGLDIAPDGTFYAALTDNADDLTRLYRFNGAGLAIPVGTIGDGAEEALSLTILPDPPAPPGPPAPPPPADATRPVVLVALAKTTLRLGALKRGLAYEFSCNEACTASATLSIQGRASAKLARGTASLAAAGRGRIRIKTTKAGRRLVAGLRRAKRRRTKVTLATVVTDAAGNRTTVRRTLVLLR
jgi:hypothetical protein